eukprot:SAG31_NODE_10071_length_1187_cov_12.488971_1_plen_80_part_00
MEAAYRVKSDSNLRKHSANQPSWQERRREMAREALTKKQSLLKQAHDGKWGERKAARAELRQFQQQAKLRRLYSITLRE